MVVFSFFFFVSSSLPPPLFFFNCLPQIYSILVAVVIVILLFVITKENNPEKISIILTCGVFIGISFPLIVIFLPKFYKLWKEMSNSSTPASSKTSNGSVVSGSRTGSSFAVQL
eukprot:TRINITY_DN9754_c0_g1_i1.p1 TRINITY_DN9754_c0_g1~~TRINITY_DN9754_c0_g1_i1.p1  ORF type:complete len:114 (-),score=44.07 TRINITY_DN9754_c0_g1_i1:96-437(-)